MRILIIGAGGHGQVIADCLLRMAEAGDTVQPIGFVDDDPTRQETCVLDLPVFGPVVSLAMLDHDALILGVGNNKVRRQLYQMLSGQGYQFATAVHPRAIVAPDVAIGCGSLICAGAVINTGTTIGSNVIINTAATVDHGSQLGDHVHIAPGVHMGGDVQIGEGTLIGIGAIVMPQRRVGTWAVVGAASLVHSDVGDQTTVFGLPAAKAKRKHSSVSE